MPRFDVYNADHVQVATVVADSAASAIADTCEWKEPVYAVPVLDVTMPATLETDECLTPDCGCPPAVGYHVARVHSGTEDGMLWYVVDDADGKPVTGDGWMNREGAEMELRHPFGEGHEEAALDAPMPCHPECLNAESCSCHPAKVPADMATVRMIVSELADGENGDVVGEAEAAEVVTWCREWLVACDDMVDADLDASDRAVLAYCNRMIEGGIAFVLDDVRRLAADDGFDTRYAGKPRDMASVPRVPESYGNCEECGTFGVDTDYKGADDRSVCDNCRDEAAAYAWAWVDGEGDEEGKRWIVIGPVLNGAIEEMAIIMCRDFATVERDHPDWIVNKETDARCIVGALNSL